MMSDIKFPHKIIPEGQIGNFKIEHFKIDKAMAIRSAIKGDGLSLGEKYIKLTCKGKLLMSDTPMEQNTARDIIENAHGNVLIVGLGIGLILSQILKKKEVKRVDIIEKYREVINLIAPSFKHKSKLNIYQANVFNVISNNQILPIPMKNGIYTKGWVKEQFPSIKYDTVYFDIWNAICGDHLPEMKLLKQMGRKLMISKQKNPNRYISCWSE